MPSTSSPVKSAKVSQACEHCRSLKVRCRPSSTSGLCQKCLRSGLSACKYGDRQPRPSKYRKVDAKARIAELERRLDEVDATSVSYGERPLTLPTADVTTSNDEIESSTAWHTDLPRVDDFSTVPAILLSCGLKLETAEQYIIRFRNMSEYFPFVVLPPSTPFSMLARDSPFLCLSAVCVASSSALGTQKQLEQVFRKNLLRRLTIDGDRNLDLLQALLVYLAFYQFFSTPKRDQSHMLLQLAISVCTDQGLDLSPSEAMNRPFGLRLEHYRKYQNPDAGQDAFFSRIARRSYLGCYYLATLNGQLFGKPIKISPTKYMSMCAQSLADDPEQDSDTVILPLFRLLRLSEQYHDHLLIARENWEEVSSLAIIRAHLEALQEQVAAQQMDGPYISSASLALEIASQNALVHAYELGLVNPVIRKAKDRTSAPYTTSSSVRLEILLLCFRSTLAIIQKFLHIPSDHYTLLSNIQWMPLVTSVVYLYKFSVGLPDVPEFDVRFARNAIDLSQFLKTIFGRLDGVITSDVTMDITEEPATLFTILGPILEDVRRTWERLKNLPVEECKENGDRAHSTNFSSSSTTRLFQVRIPVARRCPAKRFWMDQSHVLDSEMRSDPEEVPAQIGREQIDDVQFQVPPEFENGAGDMETGFEVDQFLWWDMYTNDAAEGIPINSHHELM